MIAHLKRWPPALIHWLGGTDLFVLLGLFLLVAGVLTFVLLLDVVRGGRMQSVDEQILRWARGLGGGQMAPPTPEEGAQSRPPHPPPTMPEEVGRDLTALGGVAVLTFMTLAVTGYLLISRKYHAAWLVLLATLGGLLLSSLLKHVIDRPRPNVVPHLSASLTSSFPSGHSMMAAVVYLTLATLLNRFVRQQRVKLYVLSLAVLLTLLVGVSRVYMGVHYLTDVLAGWSAGLAWAVVCWLVARWLQRRGAVEKAG
jgi:undecaprenyl-diphosphatase